jgi:hypothetical protein
MQAPQVKTVSVFCTVERFCSLLEQAVQCKFHSNRIYKAMSGGASCTAKAPYNQTMHSNGCRSRLFSADSIGTEPYEAMSIGRDYTKQCLEEQVLQCRLHRNRLYEGVLGVGVGVIAANDFRLSYNEPPQGHTGQSQQEQSSTTSGVRL